MAATAVVEAGRPTLRIRGTAYPVLLPTLRDPRLHLAAVIVSLQVLGQVAFDFRLSIAQILVAVLTSAALEVAIALRTQRVLMWPASALLTGNGVAFILRVPGTEHGEWWSLRGWWIFAGAAAVALLSKHVVRFRGGHVFNPSNLGLVLCFLLLGSERADPLDFWWGPMSAWMVLALTIIVAGGLAILSRLRLLEIAVGFWLAFAAGLAVLAASGHELTARWHLGPVTGWELWRVLAFSPEILVFLFFMITDPRTIPRGRTARRVYAVAIGLLAVVLIAPQTTEFGSKVAVLGALALVCAARPVLIRLRRPRLPEPPGRALRSALALAGAAAFAGLVVLAGSPARPEAAPRALPLRSLPEIVVAAPGGETTEIGRAAARQIAADVVDALRVEAAAARTRVGGGSVVVPKYTVERMELRLDRGEGQGEPLVVAELHGTVELLTYAGSPPAVAARGRRATFERTLDLVRDRGRYVIGGSRGATPATLVAAPARTSRPGFRLEDVAAQVGLDFRHGAFRFALSNDPTAAMGGGLCWLDYDDDGWLDLFVVNSYSIQGDLTQWKRRGGTPRSALYRNVRGRFVDVSRGSGADVSLRGSGCVAADLNGDGRTDLYVTASGYDALLWNTGSGRFVEGARAAGIATFGWHAGAAVGDVDGDGRPDLYVTGYADLNTRVPESAGGFPSTFAAVRDRLYLNLGPGANGRSHFREVAAAAGVERGGADHGLGVLLTDANRDGRLDVFVANDTDANRLYENVPWPGGAAADPARLGFRLRERARNAAVADELAGMGVAAADADGDARPDLFVTNSHRQLHGVFASRGRGFADVRRDFAPAFDTRYAGWGVAWTDLDLDGDLELVLANGAIPVTDLAQDAEPVQVLAGGAAQVEDVSASVLARAPRVIGRGLAAADYDNDGDLDVAINSIAGPLVLLRNAGAKGHWLEVRLRSFSPGATVTAVLPGGRTLVREVHAGSSYLSSEDPRVHFGLGAARVVERLEVRLPGGRVLRRANVPADRVVTLG